MSSQVKYLHSAMPGAPVISNGFGDLIDMLDACLINGFNLKTIDSINRVGDVATATFSAGHGYEVGQYVLIAGVTESEYNGEKLITAITSTTVTFNVLGTPVTPATTGAAMTAKVAALGFETAFTGTNKRAYRSPNVLSSRPYLRVDGSQLAGYDASGIKFCRVTVAEGMSDIDTFVGARAPYDPSEPTKNEAKTTVSGVDYFGWYKWVSAGDQANYNADSDGGAGARAWRIIGDDRGFFLLIKQTTTASNPALYAFGDIKSFKPSDAYATHLVASHEFNTYHYHTSDAAKYNEINTLNDLNRILLRDHTQVGGHCGAALSCLATTSSVLQSGLGYTPFPNGPDQSLLIFPSFIIQRDYNLRGVLPGQFAILNGGSPYSDGVILDNIPEYPNRKFLIVSIFNSDPTSSTGRLAFDITGPWR